MLELTRNSDGELTIITKYTTYICRDGLLIKPEATEYRELNCKPFTAEEIMSKYAAGYTLNKVDIEVKRCQK